MKQQPKAPDNGAYDEVDQLPADLTVAREIGAAFATGIGALWRAVCDRHDDDFDDQEARR